MILSLSGSIGAIGVNMQTGLRMAIEEINSAGGIMGRKVELIERDDAGDPTKARTAAEELVEKQGVSLIIGTTISSPALAIAPYATERKAFMLGSPSADQVNDPKQYPYLFTGTIISSMQAQIVVKYVAEVMKAKKIGILAESTAYGNSTVAAYKAELEKRGFTNPPTEQIPQGAQDATLQVNNLKKAGVDAVLAATLSMDSVRVLKAMQSAGWEVPYVGTSDLSSSVVINGVGVDGMKRVYSYNQERMSFSDKKPLTPKTRDFLDKLSKKLNQKPLKDSAQMHSLYYDLGYILKWAVEKAQSTEGPKVAAALETMKDFEGAHAVWTFTKDNHVGLGLDDIVMAQSAGLKDGAFEMAPGY
ncbi:MAG: hypothetical protein EPO21_14200 [Chloroflexota bacterium]|nr:MAG: hypothetical protein EPO21_14200 [Chloroflexota bacterium]